MNEKTDAILTNGQASLKDRVRELQLSNRLDGGKPGKSGGSTAWLPWLLCILMALAWAGVGIRAYKNSGSGNNGATGAADAVQKKTEGGSSRQAAGEIVLESKGYLIPSHQISVSPIDVAGRITVLKIEEGLTFKEGDILAVIDSTRYDADKKEAEAQVANARAKLVEMRSSTELEIKQAEYELAEAQAQQAEALIVWETAKSTASGAVAKLEINQANKKYDAAAEHVKALEKKLSIVRDEPRKQRIIAAERDLSAAQARLDRALWSYDNCTIRSPVTGVILTKKAEIGGLINPVVGGVSTSLCEIADLSQLEVDLEIQERDVAKLEVGMACRIRPDAYAERSYDGVVDRMMPIANRARGIIPVRVRVLIPEKEKQGEYLKPEMGVSVTFIKGGPPEMLPAPHIFKSAQAKQTAAKDAKLDSPVTVLEPKK